MSITDTSRRTSYLSSAKLDRLPKVEHTHEFLEWWMLPEVLLRNTSLAAAGLNTSVDQPLEFYTPSSQLAGKPHLLFPQGETLKTHVAKVMHDGCGQGISPFSVGENVGGMGAGRYAADERTPPENGIHSLVLLPDVAMTIGRGPLNCRRSTTDACSRSQQLKFGIERILSIGHTEPTKTHSAIDRTASVQLSGRWNRTLVGEDSIMARRRTHPFVDPSVGGAVLASTAYSHSRGLWSAIMRHHPNGIWNAGASATEIGRSGWPQGQQCNEYKDDFHSNHGPYSWARNTDQTPSSHCFPLQPTLPPPHPTLPRSFHHPITVSSTRSSRSPDNGLESKCSNGGSSGIARDGISSGHKRKRSWSRAVFTSLQRKGLEKRFVMQKYVNKPERRQLASALGLSDAQVKVWFQNRRMKWRHTQQFKHEQQPPQGSADINDIHTNDNGDNNDKQCDDYIMYSSMKDIKVDDDKGGDEDNDNIVKEHTSTDDKHEHAITKLKNQ